MCQIFLKQVSLFLRKYSTSCTVCNGAPVLWTSLRSRSTGQAVRRDFAGSGRAILSGEENHPAIRVLFVYFCKRLKAHTLSEGSTAVKRAEENSRNGTPGTELSERNSRNGTPGTAFSSKVPAPQPGSSQSN